MKMAWCQACGGTGKRLNPRLLVLLSGHGNRCRIINHSRGLPIVVTCTECIGGITSCCDGAASAGSEIEDLPQPANQETA